MWGMEQMPAALAKKNKKHVINICNIIQSSWLHWFPKEIITLGKFNSEIL